MVHGPWFTSITPGSAIDLWFLWVKPPFREPNPCSGGWSQGQSVRQRGVGTTFAPCSFTTTHGSTPEAPKLKHNLVSLLSGRLHSSIKSCDRQFLGMDNSYPTFSHILKGLGMTMLTLGGDELRDRSSGSAPPHVAATSARWKAPCGAEPVESMCQAGRLCYLRFVLNMSNTMVFVCLNRQLCVWTLRQV